ncbi:MAG: hydroxyacylglutathione hydrolase [Pseudomonadota bacterium]
MGLKCHQYSCLEDNYGVLVRDESSGRVAVIDVPEEMATRQAIEQTGWEPTDIFLTHHHWDHIDGVGGIRSSFDVKVTGNAADARRLPKLDNAVHEGEIVSLGETEFQVIDTPGHTVGHIAYVSEAAKVGFVGDTLFSLGCGRMAEGSAAQFFDSLQKLSRLNPETNLYCGHEYTLTNARFALSLQPENKALSEVVRDINERRSQGKPTLPTTLAFECEFNPFLLARSAEEFASVRTAKDNFR